MSKFNLGNLGGLMKNAKKLQGMMEEAQEKLANTKVVGEAGGGLVKITLTAKHKAIEVIVDDEVLQEDKVILQDLIAAAINDGTQKIEAITQDEMMDAGKLFDLGQNDPEEKE